MRPPRVVLDSNVVISAYLFGGLPARVLGLVVDGAARGFTSIPILDEIRDVLQRPKFGLTPEQAITLVEELHAVCAVVEPGSRVLAVPQDPDDHRILECALEAQAEVIVTGDAHLLGLRAWRGIRILTPAQFLDSTTDDVRPGTLPSRRRRRRAGR